MAGRKSKTQPPIVSSKKPKINGVEHPSEKLVKESVATRTRKRKAADVHTDLNSNERRSSKRQRLSNLSKQAVSQPKTNVTKKTIVKASNHKEKPLTVRSKLKTIKKVTRKSKVNVKTINAATKTVKKIAQKNKSKLKSTLHNKIKSSSRKGKKVSKKLSNSEAPLLPKNKKSVKKTISKAVTLDTQDGGALIQKKKRKSKKTLEPKLHVTEYLKDPTFETNEEIPHISTLAHSRLLIRAVNLNDTKMLKTLINDKKSICSFTVPRSLNINRDAFSYALEKHNMEAIKILLDSKLTQNLARFPDIILSDEQTGFNSTMMFGHALRKVTVGRGGKEGNNALLKDRSIYSSYEKSVNYITYDMAKEALTYGFPRPLIQKLSEIFPDLQANICSNFINGVVCAIRSGHNQLAGQLIEEGLSKGGYGFNLLHKEALLNTTEPLTPFKPVSVIKKVNLNDRITPVHCAATNPNAAYLTAILNSRPDYGILDTQNWGIIHYAAVCTGTGPLQVLLNRGISTLQINKNGETPLHLAAALGRLENVKLLLDHEEVNDVEMESDSPKDIAGTLIERTNKTGQTALHKAAETGQTAVVQLLLKAGSLASKFTPARYDKLTPLMFAARHGHVDVIKILVEHGVKVDIVDHKGRTALTHAVINGQAHAVSYLLRIGANHLKKDTSGNTLIHYSAAYGWYFCLKLLIEAGCSPNEPNDWKMTPLAISFMKGHMGLVEYILKQPGVDINSRINDSSGVTLLLQAMSSKPTSEFYSRIKFLLVEQNADCNIGDFQGNNAFHYLVETEYREKAADRNCENTNATYYMKLHGKDKKYENSETQKFVFQTMKLLWDHKCNPYALNYDRETPVFFAVKYGCFSLLNKLFDLSDSLPDESNKHGNTLLHAIVNQVQYGQAITICKRWSKDPTKLEVMKRMANAYNKCGYTPLLWLLNQITVVTDANFVKNIIHFIAFLVNTLEADVAAVDRTKKSGQSVIHLASQVSYAEEAFEIILSQNPSLEVLNHSLQTPLALAIINGKENAAKALLNAGADINFKTKSGESLYLLYAMNQTKSFSLIPLMIEKGANIHEANRHTKNSLLHYICRKPHLPFAVESVRKLLENGININAVNKDGRTAMHLAVNFRAGETDDSYEIEDLLIQSNIKLNIRDIRGRIPLHMVFVKIGKHSDSSFMDPIELVTTLVRAMKHSLPNFIDEVKLADEFGCTPVHYAAIRGATISCSYLLMETNSNVDIQDRNRNTPFGLAVLHGHEGCALQFQQNEADFLRNLNTNLTENIFNEFTNIPWEWEFAKLQKTEFDRKKFEKNNYPILQEVVRKNWQGILHLMLEKLHNSGAGVAIAIAAAINTNRFKLTLKLVNRASPSDLVPNGDGENLLHILAKNKTKEDIKQELVQQIVDVLVSKGVDPTGLDKNLSTPLMHAAANLNLILCNLLELLSNALNEDFALDLADKFDRTVFAGAFWKINDKTEFTTDWKLWLESLLVKGASANVGCKYPIMIHPYPGVRYLRCETRTNYTTNKYSPLVMAVIAGNYSIVKWLLTMNIPNKADVNFQDDDGRTALMHAVRLNDIKMVHLILNPNKYDHNKDIHPWKKIPSKLPCDKTVLLNIQDRKGWTAMDHIVAGHEGNFCYANSDVIVRVLHSAGAEISQKSGDGMSPLERAIKLKRVWLVDCMEQLSRLPKDKLTTFTEASEEIFEMNSNGNPCYSLITSYSNDCQSMIEVMDESDEENEMEDQVEPDDLVSSDSNDKLKVIFDTEQKIHFNCCLTKVDVSYGVYGIYNFYKMQLLKEERGKEMIYLFTRWGRVGDDGQYQKTPFVSEEEAIKEFKKIFRSKTGNTWENLESFTAIHKKYRLVALETNGKRKSNQVKIDFDKFKDTRKIKISSLPLYLLKLMENLTMVHKSKVKFSGFDSEYNDELPFGSLTFETLKKGAELLEEIEKLIKKRDGAKLQPGFLAINEISFMESVLKPSEDFYALIPVYGFSKEKLKPIFNLDELREKQNVIHKLIHLEFASQLLAAAEFNLHVLNPFEYIFRCLNTKLESLDEEQEEAQLILQYIHNTSSHPENDCKLPKIIRIFRIERSGEKERMENCGIGNPYLLWHGTSAVNILSILHRGLMITPLEANLSGHLFGKGIYFADMFMKSTKYSNGNNPKYMFLCEVALGKIHPIKLNYWDVQSNKPLPSTCNSIKTMDSKWEPDPASTLLWKGRTVPLGRSVQNILPENQYHGLDHNEFVVFNENQVKLRYLIQYADSS